VTPVGCVRNDEPSVLTAWAVALTLSVAHIGSSLEERFAHIEGLHPAQAEVVDG
jgi:hypothetical protein